MGRELTALFTSSLVLLLCPHPDAFVPSPKGATHRSSSLLTRRTHPTLSRWCWSGRQRVRNLHGSGQHGDREPSSQQRPPPPLPPPKEGPDSIVFRVLRGGRTSLPEPDLVEVSLDRGGAVAASGGAVAASGGGGGGGLANTAQSLRDFLFLVRSSQPGSIGEELQRRGVRVFPEEAFVDEAGVGVGASTAAVESAGSGEAEPNDDDEIMSRFSWTGGTPLPLDTQMEALPRDKEGRIRLVVWDPCGPEHPLMRAVGGEPGENASIEVLNFLLADGGAGHVSEEEARGGDRAGGRTAGGCTRGYGDDFDESRSAVVFRNWFTVEQQQAIADALAGQMFSEDDGEGPGLAIDREHFPLLRDRAALAAVGDSMLSALSSDRFSGQVGGRDPPVPTRANREFNAVCYGAQAKMQEHRDTWKEWTLMVSIGNTIPFDLGTCQGSPDARLELASGEGLLFNGYELFHEVHGVKDGTAPDFWGNHALSVKGGFARVGFLSMKSFNSKGVAAPTWGSERSSTAKA